MKSRRPVLRTSLLLALTCVNALAAPTGGVIVSGTGGITTAGTTTTVTQGSERMSLNWATFDIGTAETVRFNQPSASALAVNRIADVNGSRIQGSLQANGQVYLINPNGIIFSSTAQVNVGGLVASTLDIADSELGGSTLNFAGTGTGTVANYGTINAATGGYVALLGGTVANTGTITAPGGTVALGAGSRVALDFAGDGLVSLAVEENAVQAEATNGGLIRADGGQVLLSAGARDSLVASVVNNTGVIEARTVEDREGRIILLGGMTAGTTTAAGTLDASAPNGGDGGFIETSAAKVVIDDAVRITTAAPAGRTGTWLIDPTDFTIAASDGDMSAADLVANLATNNIEIQSIDGDNGTNGDIFVNEAISWSADNVLTLTAHRDIVFNASLTATGTTAGLVLNYGRNVTLNGNSITLSGASATLTKNSQPYTLIHNVTQLQAISADLTGYYALGNTIDASTTASWTDGTDSGFTPLGDASTAFSGTLDGLGHTINDLVINRSLSSYVGLFANNSGSITNLGLVGGSVSGHSSVGSVAGLNTGSITSTYATGAVTAGGGSYAGGLVGYNNNSGTITNAYSTGAVVGLDTTGGLVGFNSGTISQAYATGAVTAGGSYAGGLVGVNAGPITDAYATGSVLGTDTVGGLVGYNVGPITNTYATGAVSGSGTFGGLVGQNDGGTITASFWDRDSTGQLSGIVLNSGSGTPSALRSASGNSGDANYAFTQSVYTDAGWDFTTTWFMIEGSTRPFLRSEYSTSISNAHQLQLMAMDRDANYTLGANIAAAATAGTDSSGMWTTAGFSPVGTSSVSDFTGTFDGRGYTINGLVINRPTTDYVGLFGFSSGDISNVGLVGGSISGQNLVGGLTGNHRNGTISNVYSTGTVDGRETVGGLIGFSASNVISNAYATGAVSGSSNYVGGLVGNTYEDTLTDAYATGTVTGSGNYVGGLIGFNDRINDNSTLNRVHATGAVSGNNYVGGLIGSSFSGDITNAYATGAVTGAYDSVGGLIGYDDSNEISDVYATGAVSSAHGANVGGLIGYSSHSTLTNASASGSVSSDGSYVGGLVGYSDNATITGSYATGAVTGDSSVGGLVGYAENSTISNAYATGAVSGAAQYVGGLVGVTFITTISNSYATGAVSGGTYGVGGLVGYADGGAIYNAYATGAVSGGSEVGGLVGGVNFSQTITDSFWNTQTSGQSTSAGGDGLTTAQMQDPFTFIDAGWDFASIWATPTAGGAPVLRSVTSDPVYNYYVRLTGNGSAAYGATTGISGLTLGGVGTGNVTVDIVPGINAGTYAYSANNVALTYSTGVASDYYINYGTGTLTVTPRTLSVTAGDLSRAYGDANPAPTYSLTSGSLVNGDAFTGSLATTATSTSAVGGYGITQGTLAVNSNYAITFTPGTLTVTPRAITLTADNKTKVAGSANPELTYSITSGSVAFSWNLAGALFTTATTESPAGTYAITPGSIGLAVNSNYALTFVEGQLTVTAAPPVVQSSIATKTVQVFQTDLTAFDHSSYDLSLGSLVTGVFQEFVGTTSPINVEQNGNIIKLESTTSNFVLNIQPLPIVGQSSDSDLFENKSGGTSTLGGEGIEMR